MSDPLTRSDAAWNLFSRRLGLQTNEERVSELLGLLQSNLNAYDVILGKQKYLAGDVRLVFLSYSGFELMDIQSVTLADLSHLPHGTVFYGAGFHNVFESRPNLAR